MEPFDSQNPRRTVTLKIADFDEFKDRDYSTTLPFVGDVSYMAPEVLADQQFSKASDVWSFGVLLWEMLSGEIPHKGLQRWEIIYKSLGGELDGLFIAPSFPGCYQFILKQCWKSTCDERFSFQQILGVLLPPEIFGLSSLHQEAFISRVKYPVIEVYDSTTFAFKRRMAVDGLTLPSNLVSCSINTCLYTADSKWRKHHPSILKIDPITGNLIKAWNIGQYRNTMSCRILLSVANDSNLIVSINSENCLHEYTAHGELIRTIDLYSYVDGRITPSFEAAHAIKLASGLFVVCSSNRDVVYLLSTKEISSPSNSERLHMVEVLMEFSKLPGELDNTLGCLDYLSVNKDGSILVSDLYNNRAVLLSQNLDRAQILVSEQYGMKSSIITCFDESTGKWLVTDGGRIFVCRMKDGKADIEIYEIISLKDNQD